MVETNQEKIKAEIDKLSRLEMARLWRYASSDCIYFDNRNPEIVEHFKKRFEDLGGWSPNISKAIGWDG
jgi:hypothetical protein